MSANTRQSDDRTNRAGGSSPSSLHLSPQPGALTPQMPAPTNISTSHNATTVTASTLTFREVVRHSSSITSSGDAAAGQQTQLHHLHETVGARAEPHNNADPHASSASYTTSTTTPPQQYPTHEPGKRREAAEQGDSNPERSGDVLGAHGGGESGESAPHHLSLTSASSPREGGATSVPGLGSRSQAHLDPTRLGPADDANLRIIHLRNVPLAKSFEQMKRLLGGIPISHTSHLRVVRNDEEPGWDPREERLFEDTYDFATLDPADRQREVGHDEHPVIISPYILFPCGDSRGEAYVELLSAADAQRAVALLSRQHHRRPVGGGGATGGGGDRTIAAEVSNEAARFKALMDYRLYMRANNREQYLLRLRGLPFTETEDTVRDWVLQTAGTLLTKDDVRSIQITRDSAGNNTGDAFVELARAELQPIVKRLLHMRTMNEGSTNPRYIEVMLTTPQDRNSILETQVRRQTARPSRGQGRGGVEGGAFHGGLPMGGSVVPQPTEAPRWGGVTSSAAPPVFGYTILPSVPSSAPISVAAMPEQGPGTGAFTAMQWQPYVQQQYSHHHQQQQQQSSSQGTAYLAPGVTLASQHPSSSLPGQSQAGTLVTPADSSRTGGFFIQVASGQFQQISVAAPDGQQQPQQQFVIVQHASASPQHPPPPAQPQQSNLQPGVFITSSGGRLEPISAHVQPPPQQRPSAQQFVYVQQQIPQSQPPQQQYVAVAAGSAPGLNAFYPMSPSTQPQQPQQQQQQQQSFYGGAVLPQPFTQVFAPSQPPSQPQARQAERAPTYHVFSGTPHTFAFPSPTSTPPQHTPEQTWLSQPPPRSPPQAPSPHHPELMLSAARPSAAAPLQPPHQRQQQAQPTPPYRGSPSWPSPCVISLTGLTDEMFTAAVLHGVFGGIQFGRVRVARAPAPPNAPRRSSTAPPPRRYLTAFIEVASMKEVETLERRSGPFTFRPDPVSAATVAIGLTLTRSSHAAADRLGAVDVHLS